LITTVKLTQCPTDSCENCNRFFEDSLGLGLSIQCRCKCHVTEKGGVSISTPETTTTNIQTPSQKENKDGICQRTTDTFGKVTGDTDDNREREI
jgi:hypothetical protein